MNHSLLHTEFSFRSSRSSGSGGQHVNKVETRVELLFDLANSQILTEEEKDLLAKRWRNRLSKEGILRLVSQKSRSQYRNKQKAVEHFFVLLEEGLKVKKSRKPHKVSKAAKNKRLAAKRQNAEKKAARQKVRLDN